MDDTIHVITVHTHPKTNSSDEEHYCGVGQTTKYMTKKHTHTIPSNMKRQLKFSDLVLTEDVKNQTLHVTEGRRLEEATQWTIYTQICNI